MNIRDRSGLRQQAQQRLSLAVFDPRKLILLHTGVSLGVSFSITLLNFLVSRQMEGVGGLAGMESQAMLETAQTVLQLISTVVLPFWQVGVFCAAIRLARKEEAVPATLLGGFRRIGPVLRLQILQSLLLIVLCIACMYFCTVVYMMTPMAQPLMDALTPLVEQTSVLNQEMVLDEATMALMMTHMEPLTVISLVLVAAVAIPLLLRLRFCQHLVMDGEDRAMAAMARSWKMTKGNTFAMLKVDLGFWSFYLLLSVSLAVSYGDLLLPLVGISLPMSAEAAGFLFYSLYMLVQLGVYWWMGHRVYTTYALCYDALLQPKPVSSVAVTPANQPWDY